MFKYDFIIIYEHRNRELENAVLLAMMLEKKGYKVVVEYRWSARLLFQKADVIITPYLYKNEVVVDFSLQPFCHIKKIINMQYEQIFFKEDEEKLGDLPEGQAKNAVHISWGQNTTDRYKKAGINPNNIFEIGHVSMDLNMSKYKSSFLNKKELSQNFSIPSEKKWLLFISSFSYIGLDRTTFEKCKNRSGRVDFFTDISYKSQPVILNYLEQLAKDFPELIVIYRPHPFESGCHRLVELKNKYDNFKVIAKHSIRQWILVSDYISTWCSTSLVDVLFAQKPCAIIRPIPFQEENDYRIYRDQKIISEYRNLKEFINNPDERFAVNPRTIKNYYRNDFDACTFEMLRDKCIQVRNCKKFEFNYYEAIHPSPILLLKYHVYRILMSLAKFIDYSRLAPEKYRTDIKLAHKEMKESGKEIKFYRKRFSGIVANEDA